jgi:uncharacterized membrane protein
MRKFNLLAMLFVSATLVAGCNYSVDKNPRSGSSKPTNGVGNTPGESNDGAEDGTVQNPGEKEGDSSEGEVSAATYQQIAPILEKKCQGCHNDQRRVADLSVQTWNELVTNNRAVIPGNPEDSGIYASVVDDFMPPKSAVARGQVQALTPEEKSALREWIAAGALNN